MKYKVLVVVVCAVLLQQCVECKRSGGRSRGSSSRGSTGLWGNNNKKKSESGNGAAAKPATNADLVALSYPKQTGSLPAAKPKPSAPKLETQKVQKPVSNIAPANQNKPAVGSAPASNAQSNQQRPIGWDVPKQPGQGQLQTKSVATNQQSAGGPPAYAAQPGHVQGAPPPYSAGSYGQGAPPAYNPGSYGQHYPQGAPPAYTPNGYHQAPPPAYSAGGYGGYGQPAHGSYGHAAPNYGQGYNPHQPYSGVHPGQYNQMGGMQHGGGGGMFGGSPFGGGYKSGYGGYGMGGYGGYGGMMGPKRSFGSGFASTAFTSIATGLLVWSLMRGGRSQHYNVYNHYNNPEAVPQELTLPANIITLCSENVTLLCAPNTVPLCTANETILCAVTASATVPCVDNVGASCVDTSLPCTENCDGEKEDPPLALPCIANATVSGQVNLGNSDMSMSLFKQTPQNTDTVLCVTTMAMPSPEEDKAAEAAMQATASPQIPLIPNAPNPPPIDSTSDLPTTR